MVIGKVGGRWLNACASLCLRSSAVWGVVKVRSPDDGLVRPHLSCHGHQATPTSSPDSRYSFEGGKDRGTLR
ncbi:hypothetical protein EDB87DRAFT_1628466 [Lactarius vividus]|nr:hypothetical protein EDB87DRAFT_1628466 [Lactarius vividus]